MRTHRADVPPVGSLLNPLLNPDARRTRLADQGREMTVRVWEDERLDAASTALQRLAGAADDGLLNTSSPCLVQRRYRSLKRGVEPLVTCSEDVISLRSSGGVYGPAALEVALQVGNRTGDNGDSSSSWTAV